MSLYSSPHVSTVTSSVEATAIQHWSVLVVPPIQGQSTSSTSSFFAFVVFVGAFPRTVSLLMSTRTPTITKVVVPHLVGMNVEAGDVFGWNGR